MAHHGAAARTARARRRTTAASPDRRPRSRRSSPRRSRRRPRRSACAPACCRRRRTAARRPVGGHRRLRQRHGETRPGARGRRRSSSPRAKSSRSPVPVDDQARHRGHVGRGRRAAPPPARAARSGSGRVSLLSSATASPAAAADQPIVAGAEAQVDLAAQHAHRGMGARAATPRCRRRSRCRAPGSPTGRPGSSCRRQRLEADLEVRAAVPAEQATVTRATSCVGAAHRSAAAHRDPRSQPRGPAARAERPAVGGRRASASAVREARPWSGRAPAPGRTPPAARAPAPSANSARQPQARLRVALAASASPRAQGVNAERPLGVARRHHPTRRRARAPGGRSCRPRWRSAGQPAAARVEEAGAQRQPRLQTRRVGGGQQIDVAQQVVAALRRHPVERAPRSASQRPRCAAPALDLGPQPLRRRLRVRVANQQQPPVADRASRSKRVEQRPRVVPVVEPAEQDAPLAGGRAAADTADAPAAVRERRTAPRAIKPAKVGVGAPPAPG